MKKEITNIQSYEYVKQLKKQLFNKEISKYDIAHKMFRRANADWIIKHVNKAKLTITYLNGKTRKLPTYNELMKRVKWSNADHYKHKRREYIKKYYKVINAFTKHRAKFKTNTLGNVFNNLKINVLKTQ
tara:strand:+ start:2882 stop:3268 length:387 start_codon:yes stop_codon:yes gene_type:complete